MNENELMQDNEISLFDPWEKLQAGWNYVAGGAFLGLLIAGLVLVVVISPKYEATTVIQIGLIGSVGKEIQGSNSIPVEPASQSVERINTPTFQLKAATASGSQSWLEDLTSSNTGISKDISVQVIKDTVAPGQTPLVELKANGDSVEMAKKRAEVSVAQLAKIHEKLAVPVLSKMNAELSILKQKLVLPKKKALA